MSERMPPELRARLLKVSGAGVLAIAAVLGSWYEGRYLTPYIDPVGILTVCDGITGPEVIRGKRYTHQECNELQNKHLKIALHVAKKHLKNFDGYTEWRKAALVDFVYNVGEPKFAASTMVKKFNAGNEYGGCAELMKWVNGRVKGVMTPLKGLVLRRTTENDLCTNWG